ncbi:MAG: hypothetical protein AVDCRST_MAG70-2234 [uncultured Thermomicrobiales bacterium]|uniref:Uncharacterized protein n=1 Tax=uncultured Thermomicrobiales bacterium TaxID=1645740 RepID=A0A6J4V343_9BACT|nr:MAG: hypothetical protein AVDCRST_MAG70-2234 [uncultured Thermomicrobiales bacterium]
MTIVEQDRRDHFMADHCHFVPTDPLPGTSRVEEPFPLMILVHGAGATAANQSLAWIEHLVQRGADKRPVLRRATGSIRTTGSSK